MPNTATKGHEQIASYWKKVKPNSNTNSLNKVQCLLCPHRCIISDCKTGICKVRINRKGVLYAVTYERPVSIAIDPIEKKPLYHFNPGQKILSIGTYGCNLSCSFCQNCDISKEFQEEDISKLQTITSDEIIRLCKINNLNMIAYTYNEPTIFYEYMLEIAKKADKNNILNVLVTNGFIERKPLLELMPFIDAANIDLKSINNTFYSKKCKAKLNPVLATIKNLAKIKTCHIEITTLIIPNENDSIQEIEKIAKWINSNCGKNTPYHLSRFFPNYQMLQKSPTDKNKILELQKIAQTHLTRVYCGNMR